MKTVPVATFTDRPAAETLTKKLLDAGIHSEIHDESKWEKLWFVTKPIAGIHVEVQWENFEQALGLIGKWDTTEHVLQEAIRCPECKSANIEFPQFTEKFIMPNLIGILSAFGVFEKEFYCRDCHYTWPNPEAPCKPKKRRRSSPHAVIEEYSRQVHREDRV